jgi:hypothetical protein
MGGDPLKKQWQSMKLSYVGRVGDVMRGMNGSNQDPGQGTFTKNGGGVPGGG